MGKLKTFYRLDGDDKSPKAYLEALNVLLTDRLDDLASMSDTKTNSGQARQAALSDARDAVDDIIADVIAGLEG